MYTSAKAPFLKLITALGKRKERRHFNKPPVYIGGCGRSGTTLLLSMLSAHPQIFACPEELSMYDDLVVGPTGRKTPRRIDRLYRTFLSHHIPSTADRWCEKTPFNVNRFDAIDEFHSGQFKFINIVRDGRDVILSRHPSDPDRYWISPERWVRDVSAGRDIEAQPQTLTITYEQLILNETESLQLICDHLEIDLHSDLVDWHNHATVRQNRAYFGELKPAHMSSLAKWKKPENIDRAEELIRIPEAVELLKHYGYETP